ncbi:unnamed protein product [Linum tenue]|uniref:Uncharacterized protein n=1 Tax=Linum tenue TaxID=586396 RepID=A0AAV0MRQ9_9ROSI|nr:unnamed protein product [Linum tenue]
MLIPQIPSLLLLREKKFTTRRPLMVPLKSPGWDGLSPIFFQRCWTIVG